MQRSGYGPTIMNGPTWPSEALPHNRNWPWWHKLYFWRLLKMGDYRVTSWPRICHNAVLIHKNQIREVRGYAATLVFEY